jgi:hypothetical protein
MSIQEQVQQQQTIALAKYASDIEQRQLQRNSKASKQGVIVNVEQGGAWVKIRDEDGGGTSFVAIDVGRAYAEAQAITVTGDRGYF